MKAPPEDPFATPSGRTLRNALRKTPSQRPPEDPLRNLFRRPPLGYSFEDPFGACRVSRNSFGVIPKPYRVPLRSFVGTSFGSLRSMTPVLKTSPEATLRNPFRNHLRSTTRVPECQSRKTPRSLRDATLPEAPECTVKPSE